MRAFIYSALPVRVIFGRGTVSQVADEVRRLGLNRALVLSTPPQADQAGKLSTELGQLLAGVFTHATMHTPVDITEQALQVTQQRNVDCLIALGGGSTTGLSKALALRTDLPQIAVPTTYAGSEATPILGQLERGQKTTLRDLKVLPEVIIYDIDLTLTLPAALSVTSGINAMAHAAEALYSSDANPVTTQLALNGFSALVGALPKIICDPTDGEARSDALYGAWACGTCLGSVGMALHHKLCHVVAGSFDLPHAETHAVILPHALAYNEPVAKEALRPLAKMLGAPTAAQGLFDLARRLIAPRSLKELGMTHEALDLAADLAVSNTYPNPMPLDRTSIHALLEDAFEGRPPRSQANGSRDQGQDQQEIVHA